MPEPDERQDRPDFSVVFTKMREAENAETNQRVALVAEQVETIRLLQQTVPDYELPYASTFMSA